MISVSFYFEVHQPYRIRPYSFFDIGVNPYYLDDDKNRRIIRKVGDKCYMPTTNLLLDLIKRGRFKCTFSLSGLVIDQLRRWYPEVLDNFKRLADTGMVEFLGETYYHSLSSLFSEREFRAQVLRHLECIRHEFGCTPSSFRNTELIYSNRIASIAEDMGFKSILMEGAERVLDWRSPNFVYRPRNAQHIKILMKNYKLSDDIAFRFGDKSWKDYPLTTEKWTRWIHSIAGNGTNVNLFMDFETFGEHQWADTGIFEFMKAVPEKILRHPDFHFSTVTEAAKKNEPVGEIDTEAPVSWADVERDVSAWLGNSMQRQAIQALYELEDSVYATGDPDLLEVFRKLQTSDHFYYMCTKYFNDGDVHRYFSPYQSPHDAYIYYMNVLQDLRIRIKDRREATPAVPPPPGHA